jgi:hypothetical protein
MADLPIWVDVAGGHMGTEASSTLSADEFDTTGTRPVGGPVPVAWREGTLTRAKELESLCAWILASLPKDQPQLILDCTPGTSCCGLAGAVGGPELLRTAAFTDKGGNRFTRLAVPGSIERRCMCRFPPHADREGRSVPQAIVSPQLSRRPSTPGQLPPQRRYASAPRSTKGHPCERPPTPCRS